MSRLITEMFSSFSTVIKSLAGGIKLAFENLIYVDPSLGVNHFSPLVNFIFIMAGVGLAMGILYKIFGMIRARKG